MSITIPSTDMRMDLGGIPDHLRCAYLDARDAFEMATKSLSLANTVKFDETRANFESASSEICLWQLSCGTGDFTRTDDKLLVERALWQRVLLGGEKTEVTAQVQNDRAICRINGITVMLLLSVRPID